MKIKLNDKWTIKTAKELYTYTSGISKGSQFFGTGYPYLTFTEIFHNYFVPEVLTSLVQSNERERENCSIKRGDVFLTRTSETDDELGMSCVALKDYPNATFNGFTKRLRPLTDEVVPEYAGFYFRSPIFRAAVTSMSSIITRASLNEKMLDKLPICYPSKPIQQKIASILSAYDNLIQNYKKQIEALQTAASELYKEWFVRFRFPGWQNAKFENGIPEGWKVEKLGTLANISTGKCNREDAEDDGIYPLFDRSQEIKKSNEWIKDCEAIIVPGEGTSFIPRYYKGKFNLHQRCYCVEPKYPDFGKFLFYVLMLNRKYFLSVATGATVPSLRYNNFASMKFILPEICLCNNFNKIADDIFAKVDNLQQQITNLTQQRDLLLPRLMSGKLEVK